MNKSTIVAMATAPGESALALIRASGPDCPTLLKSIFGKTPKPRQATLLAYKNQVGQILDHLIVLYYPDNQSFTGDPSFELIPHGSPFICQKIIEDLCTRGCRIAEAGEFTRTAFLNGKLDLSQAEAIIDLIHARSSKALEAARRQLTGALGRKMDELIARLLGITAHLEAYIDFPEEDLPPEDQDGPLKNLAELIQETKNLISTQQYKSLLHEGVKSVILGEPNAGKSSLLNALIGEERVIVSAEPGTTRDYIEERISLGSHLLRIIDTAGLHETLSEIEQMGISRSLEQMEKADLIILVVDSTRPHPTLPQKALEVIDNKVVIVVENKIDLAQSKHLNDFVPSCPHVRISASNSLGINDLKEKILNLLEDHIVRPSDDAILISGRHATALSSAQKSLEEALAQLKKGQEPELVAVQLRDAIDSFGEITGKIDNEQMLDALFQSFCIGK